MIDEEGWRSSHARTGFTIRRMYSSVTTLQSRPQSTLVPLAPCRIQHDNTTSVEKHIEAIARREKDFPAPHHQNSTCAPWRRRISTASELDRPFPATSVPAHSFRWDFCSLAFRSKSKLESHLHHDHVAHQRSEEVFCKRRKIAPGTYILLSSQRLAGEFVDSHSHCVVVPVLDVHWAQLPSCTC